MAARDPRLYFYDTIADRFDDLVPPLFRPTWPLLRRRPDDD